MATETLRGVVGRVFFSKPEGPFMAGQLKLDDSGRLVRFSGKLVAQPGDRLELTGEWANHPRFGEQFEAETGIVKLNESPDALAHLLASDERFKGLGPARARKVVDAALALSTDGNMASALIEFPNEVAARAGVALEIVQNASAVWQEKRSYFDALALLVDQGWSNAQAQQILHVFGENAPAIARGDPYLLIGRVPRFGFRTVDAVARKMGALAADPARLMAGVAYCLDKIGEEGNTWTTRQALNESAVRELRPDTLDAEAGIDAAIQKLIDVGAIHLDRSPLETELVADARTARAEFEVFEILLRGLKARADVELAFAGPRATDVMATLNEGQARALAGISRYRFNVLSGGAGVGKTYLQRAVCEVAEENGLRVALCAPTGKAARRLQQATQRRACTIHRLLDPQFDEMSGLFRFTRHQGRRLDVDLVIVDESSMVEVKLWRALLVALPDHARLLIVGDHNQIPSVGAGAVLRDILAGHKAYPGAVHILLEIVRQAGVLARNTTALLDGVVVAQDVPAWRIHRTERGHEVGTEQHVVDVVESLVAGPAEPFGRPLMLALDVQVLAPKRKGPLGTYALNVKLQALQQRLLGHPEPPPTEQDKPPKPLVGDRVIWIVNDYDLELFNGTQAIVLSVNDNGSLEIFVEDGREVTIPPGKRKNIEVAWAMTIHKAQGSEWPAVVLVVSSAHRFMRDRALLYTGASRAAEALVIVGDMQGIRAFADHRRATARETFGKFLVHGWAPTLAQAAPLFR